MPLQPHLRCMALIECGSAVLESLWGVSWIADVCGQDCFARRYA